MSVAPAVRPRRIGHRLRGSGATTVRVVAPIPGPDKTHKSGRLYIGRRLWQDIGEPARVSLEPFGRRFLIRAGDDFAVHGRTGNSIPRLSLGASTLERIAAAEGIYPASAVRGVIRVDMHGNEAD